MKDIGKVIKEKGKVHKLGVMEQDMLENGKIIELVGKEYFIM